MLEDHRIKYLIKILRDKKVREEIKNLGGYRTTDSGSLKILDL